VQARPRLRRGNGDVTDTEPSTRWLHGRRFRVNRVGSDSTDTASTSSSTSRWTAREAELLAVTLRLLQQHGYDRLALEEVAAEAEASKATIYRRWPSKAELVLAAFTEGVRVKAAPAHSGSLRNDLLGVGFQVCRQARQHASTMSAVLSELSRSPALSVAMEDEFVHQRRLLITEILNDAIERGEIDAEAIGEEIWDVLPKYLVSRFLIPGRPPTDETVRALVDDVLMPSLTRTQTRATDDA
jgi:AcrR family transcriptional regulator